MAVGQGVLRAVLDVGALDAVEARLEQHEVTRSAAHAALLCDVLELHRVHTAGGCGLATVAQVALLTRSSEFRAGALLTEAQLLAGLPGALKALDCGLLTSSRPGWSAPSSARSTSRSGLPSGIGSPSWSGTARSIRT